VEKTRAFVIHEFDVGATVLPTEHAVPRELSQRFRPSSPGNAFQGLMRFDQHLAAVQRFVGQRIDRAYQIRKLRGTLTEILAHCLPLGGPLAPGGIVGYGRCETKTLRRQISGHV
jgi:hypothetical protein